LGFNVACLLPAFGQISFTNAGETLQVLGSYSYIYKNGAPAETNNFHFVALTTSHRWSISVTNENNSKDWGMMRYDGTNIYTLGTELGNVPSPSVNRFEIYGYAYPGQFFMPQGQDSVHLFFPWMVFHLTPQVIQSFERNGVIEIPPMYGARSSLLDYGYSWKISYLDDSGIQHIDIVRDSTLDLKSEKDELRRATVDYPFSYSPLEHRLDMLNLRTNIPEGFIRATYECKDILKTNDCRIPSAASFALFWPNFKDQREPSRVVFKLILQVNQIKLLQNVVIPEAVPFAKTYISDYRFQATNNRTKFNHAAYTLNAGESFPSGSDPKLRRQAEDWLKHGTAYDGLQSNRHMILAGMLTVTFVTIGLLVFWLRKSKIENNKHK